MNHITPFRLLFAALLILLGIGQVAAANWAFNYGPSSPPELTFDPNLVSATAVDAAGNTYIAGHLTTSTLVMGSVTLSRIGVRDAFVAKLDSAGTVQWAKNFGGNGVAGTPADLVVETVAYGLAVDSSGNVHLVGTYMGGDLTSPPLGRVGSLPVDAVADAFVIKLDAAGVVQWAKSFGGDGVGAIAYSVAVDGTGHVYLGGAAEYAGTTGAFLQPVLPRIGTAINNVDAFALKLNADGTTVWAKSFGGVGAAAEVLGIAVDGNGNAYLGGTLSGSAITDQNQTTTTTTTLTLPRIGDPADVDAFAFKLNADGVVQWAKNFGGTGVDAKAYAIAVDGVGSVYLGGGFQWGDLTVPSLPQIGDPIDTNAFALKLEGSSGNSIWSRNFGGLGADAIAYSIALDASANVYLGGLLAYADLETPELATGTLALIADPGFGDSDALAIKLNPGGTMVWAKNFGGFSANAAGYGIAVDAPGNIYLGGYFESDDLTTPALGLIGSFDPINPSNPSNPFILKQATVPDAPAGATATAGDAQAEVRFTVPALNGGATVISYTATSSAPVRSQSCSAPCTSIVVTGLTNGTSYTFTVTATNAAGTGPASLPSNAVTPLASQTITGFSPASPVVFGASPATLSATGGASGSPVVFATTSAGTICSVSGSTVTFVGVGTCNLTASQAGNANHNAAPQVTASITINAASQAITGFSPTSPVVFGASPATLSATGGASGIAVVFATTSASTVCTVAGSTVTFTGVGTCNLTASQAGNANYNAAPQVTASIVITAASQAITGFSPTSPVVFGASPATLGATGGASGIAVVFATTSANTVCTVAGSTVTFTGVGTCNLTASQAGNANYNAAPQVTASITINAANQAITGFSPTSPVVFGASPATLSATGGASGIAVVFATTSASTVCTVAGSTVTFTGVGTCNLTASQAGNANHNAAPQVTASITINAANQAITGFSPTSPVVFGASPATLGATGGASGIAVVFATTSASTVCTVAGSTVTFTGVGTCNLTASQAGNANYNAAPQVTASITINPLKTTTNPSPAGPGSITAGFTGGNGSCSFANQQFTTPASPPAGVLLSHGVFQFTTNDCGAGAALSFTITYPQALPAGTRYYKFGPEFGGRQTPHWYVLPGAVVSGNQITFTITDNGVGDSNTAAGFITDPGGPGIADPAAAAGIPTLSEWGLILLASLLGLVALGQVRRRHT